MNVPAISVAIRAWRRESVATAIASALAQSWTDLELVIYDTNGGLADLAAAPADPRVRYVPAVNHPDASVRFHGALAACRAPLIALLDDDDHYLPPALHRLHEALRAHPHAGVASGPDAGRVIADDAGLLEPREVMRRMLSSRWGVSMSNMLMRRGALDATFARTPMPFGSAPDLWLDFHIAAAGFAHVRLAEEICVRGAGRGRASGHTLGARWILKTFETFATDDAQFEAWRSTELARRRIILAAHLVCEGDTGEAAELLDLARRDAPRAHAAMRRIVAGALRGRALGRAALRVVRDLRAWLLR